MNRLFLSILLFTLLLNCKESNNTDYGSTVKSETVSDLEPKIDGIVNQYIGLDIFSGIVLVADKGNILYHKAFGLADRENNTANSINTLFDIGSMNKTFTSIVIKQLIEEGNLKLDDKLINYISGFDDPNTNKISIKHLLEHRSGFGDYHSPDYFDLPKEERKLQSIVDRAKAYQLNFEPGEEDDYSNLGYVILGAVIEKVTGKSYFTNVQERIVEPLKLENTYLNNFEGLDGKIAKGYLYSPLGKLEVNDNEQDEPNPDGGFLSTTEDVMKFYRSFYYDDILLTKQAKANDAMFQQLEELPEGKATGAAGGFPGFNTALYQVYKDDFTIIVFANMDEPVAERIALDILETTRGNTPEPPKLPAIQNVRIAFEANGTDYIKKNFEDLTTNYHPTDPKDFILNDLGYAYLYGANNPEKAIQLFKINTELFPDIANCWDSYGEGLSKLGKTQEAIAAYKKALEIRPNLSSAKKALIELKSQ